MGLGVARMGDIVTGKCYHSSHDTPINVTGVIIDGTSEVLTNGLQTTGVTARVQASCGHYGTIVTGSSTVFVGKWGVGFGTGRMGDVVSGDFRGIISSGSNTVFSG